MRLCNTILYTLFKNEFKALNVYSANKDMCSILPKKLCWRGEGEFSWSLELPRFEIFYPFWMFFHTCIKVCFIFNFFTLFYIKFCFLFNFVTLFYIKFYFFYSNLSHCFLFTFTLCRHILKYCLIIVLRYFSSKYFLVTFFHWFFIFDRFLKRQQF